MVLTPEREYDIRENLSTGENASPSCQDCNEHVLLAEVDRLREGIQRYMADDPPHATNCACLDPYPSRGATCDCGVDEFIRAATSVQPT